MLLDNAFESDLRVEKETRSLIDAGFKVSVICLEADHLPKEDIRSSIQIHRIIGTFIKHPMRDGFEQKVDQLAKQVIHFGCDAVHCNDIFMLIIGEAIKKLQPSIKLIYDSHEYLREWRFYLDTQSIVGKAKGYLVWKRLLKYEKSGCQATDLVISTTESICKELKRHYHLIVPLIEVQNVSTIEKGTGINLKQQLGIPEHHKLMVQSGNIYQDIGEMDKTLEAIFKFPDLHFVLIGNRPKFYEFKQRYDALFERLHFVEYDATKLFDMLTSCDFGYLYMQTDRYKSHLYTSPNRIMEYSRCGIPFISVEQFDARELARAFGHVIFFEIHDFKALQKAISLMLSDLTSFKASAQKASKSLDWNTEFAPVIKQYKQLLNA